ncbi:winged helix-turn-helix domain-containing protein [Phenylobacterium sp.]|jgi:DNA-binding transcriptional ArsR family regulator|uniref:ArsR/SmtB family transcription factor n=1 Tax=Phenylobacterium sp. TaxID=1871053 RepID=UPI002E357F5B|nr:winged helix-turn-helix domain-containing protein [Phenylobacterium sp.]HEX3366835.1 winged helix-turn-helix domain-containing protein [Phenylobacterium sp.]
MKVGPDIAVIAALLGDPARANMVTALSGGQALTAGELAREAGVTAQTASSHLAKLSAGGLIEGRKQGRHVYYALSGPDVAGVIEALSGLAARTGHSRVRTGPREPALRRARVCYDHLAGDLGVAMLDSLTHRGMIVGSGETLVLTSQGEAFMAALGLDLPALSSLRRPLCKGCLDWSVRRSHLAGALGAALLARFFGLGWAKREPGSRIVSFSPHGLDAFREIFGVLAEEPEALA